MVLRQTLSRRLRPSPNWNAPRSATVSGPSCVAPAGRHADWVCGSDVAVVASQLSVLSGWGVTPLITFVIGCLVPRSGTVII